MLTCLPTGFCSWDYRVSGLSTGQARVWFDEFAENGFINFGGAEYSIILRIETPTRWTLERGKVICAEAEKPRANFRRFEVRMGDVRFSVEADFPLSATFAIRMDGAAVGTIRPAHLFTRRAFIECDPAIPELAQLFAFWLVLRCWRAVNQAF